VHGLPEVLARIIHKCCDRGEQSGFISRMLSGDTLYDKQ
jgi:hypothetical protein